MNRISHLLLLLLIALLGNAQSNLQLSFNSTLGRSPFRVSYGDSLVYTIEISNVDTAEFSGNVFVAFKGSNMLDYDSISLGVLQIQAYKTVQQTIVIDVKPEYFKTGPEVVVVWPIFDNQQGNEVADFIFVKDIGSSIAEIKLNNYHYYITQNYLNCSNCDSGFKQVRIFNIAGNTIYTLSKQYFPTHLPINAAGVYFIQIDNADGTSQVLKWLRND